MLDYRVVFLRLLYSGGGLQNLIKSVDTLPRRFEHVEPEVTNRYNIYR